MASSTPHPRKVRESFAVRQSSTIVPTMASSISRATSAVTFRAHRPPHSGRGQAVTGAADGSFQVSLGAARSSGWRSGGRRPRVRSRRRRDPVPRRLSLCRAISSCRREHPVASRSGLNAWQGGDALRIVSPNTGMTLTARENELASPRAPVRRRSPGRRSTGSGVRADRRWAAATPRVAQMAAVDHHNALARQASPAASRCATGSATLAATLTPVAQD